MRPAFLQALLALQICTVAASADADTSKLDGISAWLADPEVPLLSSAQLITYMPDPPVRTPFYAYVRFNLWPVLKRIIWGDPAHGAERSLLSDAQLDLDDHYKLGEVYLWGLGGVRNLTLAAHHYEIAGLQDGDPDALFRLGMIYSTGLLGAVDEDPARAHLFYTLAAEAGSIEAQIVMGHRYKHGIHVPINLTRALQYYRSVGRRFMDLQLEAYDAENVPYTKTLKRSWAFGAEAGTGLYGKHSYRKIVTPAVRSTVALGDQSSAWQFVVTAFKDEFEDLNDAIDTLTYRADEEDETTAMYALARIYAAGIRVDDPNWTMARYYAERCVAVSRLKSAEFSHQPKLVYSLCCEFMAERIMHGGEGFEQDLELAKHYYKKAMSLREDLPERFAQCSSCTSGLALIAWREAGSPLEGDDVIAALQEAFDQSKTSNDYTLPVVLARMYIWANDTRRARSVLRKTVVDTFGRTPIVSLLLAEVDKPERQLDRFVEGIYASEELVSPVRFAHYSYMRGDLDSAVVAFLLAAELGVPAAPLNLADLLDTKHSYLGTKLNWDWLHKLSAWPLPKFVDAARRQAYAFKYFMLAAKHDSVDGLMKAVEYDMAPLSLNIQYLRILASHGFGMAHWYLGHFYETVQHNFRQAASHYRRAMATPEAWIPVKLSQLKLYYKAFGLPVPESSPHVQLSWRKAVQAYRLAFRSSIVIEDINDEDDARMAAEAGQVDASAPRVEIQFMDGSTDNGDDLVIELNLMWLVTAAALIASMIYVTPRLRGWIRAWLQRRMRRREQQEQRRQEQQQQQDHERQRLQQEQQRQQQEQEQRQQEQRQQEQQHLHEERQRLREQQRQQEQEQRQQEQQQRQQEQQQRQQEQQHLHQEQQHLHQEQQHLHQEFQRQEHQQWQQEQWQQEQWQQELPQQEHEQQRPHAGHDQPQPEEQEDVQKRLLEQQLHRAEELGRPYAEDEPRQPEEQWGQEH